VNRDFDMWIASLIIFCALFICLLFAFPKLRLIVIIVIAAILLVAWDLHGKSEMKAERARSSVKINQISLSDFRLAQQNGSWRLYGKIYNASPYYVETVVLIITIMDCPDNQKCEAIGETIVRGSANIPTLQTRFIYDVDRTNVPRYTNFKWSYGIQQIIARLD
jgi:hypothetical protein